MKKLNGKHLFLLAKIIRKSTIKEDISEIFNSVSEENNDTVKEKIGVQFALALASTLGDDVVKDVTCELLNDVFEADILEMELNDIIKNMKQLSEENNLIDFFKSAGL